VESTSTATSTSLAIVIFCILIVVPLQATSNHSLIQLIHLFLGFKLNQLFIILNCDPIWQHCSVCVSGGCNLTLDSRFGLENSEYLVCDGCQKGFGSHQWRTCNYQDNEMTRWWGNEKMK
jgi:hypothetical protein